MFSLGEIIDLAVRIEENGEKTYRQAQQEAADPDLAAVLGWLADQEAEHKKWFLALKSDVEVDREDPKLAEMARGILQGVLGDQNFSLQEADFADLESLRQLLNLSIEFEKDTIIFYEMLGGFIEDPTLIEKLDQIIEEENRHVRLLEEHRKKPSYPHP